MTLRYSRDDRQKRAGAWKDEGEGAMKVSAFGPRKRRKKKEKRKIKIRLLKKSS
jgi:hypothetical protein